MKTLFNKINLKQKFVIIFFIFLLFSIYQMLSDTIYTYNAEEIKYKQQLNNLFLVKDLNQFIYNLEKDKIETNLYLENKQTYKLKVLQKSQNLKKELKTLLITYQDTSSDVRSELNRVLNQITSVIQNIQTMNSSSVGYSYKLISHKLLLLSRLTSDVILTNTVLHSIVLKDVPFIIYGLSDFQENDFNDNISRTSFEHFIIKHMKNTNIKIKNLHINKQIINKLETYTKEIHNLINDNKQKNSFRNLSIKIIHTYSNLNGQLFSLLNQELENFHKERNFNFNIKLLIEIIAFIFTILLLLYFYKSIFTYVRKIQNAHKIKSVFLSNMSHELRTPLNAIIGFLNILKESKDEKEREIHRYHL